jgi:hypothetical protein
MTPLQKSRRKQKQSQGAKTQEDCVPKPITYKTLDPNVALVSADEKSLVTPYISFAMQQVRPCNLDEYGNGSRHFDM